MKNVVLLDDLKEADIRPDKVYDEYKELLEKDIREYFSDPSILVKIDCPGCGDKSSELAFKKMGLDYRSCRTCESLFISPRPTDDRRDLSGSYEGAVFGFEFRFR